MTLKGFKLLTSAWHLEYFKIPLSKKKYLCNQKCRELKTTQTDNQKNPIIQKQTNKKKSLPQKLTHISLENTFHALNFFYFYFCCNNTPSKSHSNGIRLSDRHSFTTLCQPFKGHFLFFSKQPSCFCGSWVQFIAPRSPSTISQLSCLNRKSKSQSYSFRLIELLKQIGEE